MHSVKQQRLLLLVGALLIVLTISSFFYRNDKKINNPLSQKPLSSRTQSQLLEYHGKTGVNALALLHQYAQIEQDQSGMVIAINGRVASTSKHEFWEFVINGKPATVGPANYITKDSDIISWKIDSY